MNHELKIWPQYFCRIADGSKTFEVRENDRGYQTGDEVTLLEWDPAIDEHDNDPLGRSMNTPLGYTGRKAGPFKIGYILPIDDRRVVFSLCPIGEQKDGGENEKGE